MEDNDVKLDSWIRFDAIISGSDCRSHPSNNSEIYLQSLVTTLSLFGEFHRFELKLKLICVVATTRRDEMFHRFFYLLSHIVPDMAIL